MARQSVFVVLSLLFLCLFQLALCGAGDTDRVDRNGRLKRPRVDAGVKRPYRVCQGFEDPEDVDCYLRADLKSYICTEPATFNPCESSRRVTTYHYDHIKHRCGKVSLPACSGYIIRAMTLIQCLIYCHNQDPYALGKSTSMVFKLNQKKPYIQKEAEIEERERAISFIDDAEYKVDSKLQEGQDALKQKEKMAKKNMKLNIKALISDAGLSTELLKDFSETDTKNTDQLMTKKVTKDVKDFLDNMIKTTKINVEELTNLKAGKKEPINKEKADQKKSEVASDGLLLDKNKKKTATDKQSKPVEKEKIEKNVAKVENKKKDILKQEVKQTDVNVKKTVALKEITTKEKKESKIEKDAKKEITDKGKALTEKKEMAKLDNVKSEAVKDTIPIERKETKKLDGRKKDYDQSDEVKGFDRKKNEMDSEQSESNHWIKAIQNEKDLTNTVKEAKLNTKMEDTKKEKEEKEDFDNNEKRGTSDDIESLQQRAHDLSDQVMKDESMTNSEKSVTNEKDTVKVEGEKKVIDLSEPTERTERKHVAKSISKKEHRGNQVSMKGMDAVHKSDSTDKSADDGFYLWDE